MIGTSRGRQCIARLERAHDWASENRADIPQLDHAGLHVAVGDTVILVDVGSSPGKLVGIDSTVAIADSIALEPVSAPKAEWQDYTAVDTEDFEGIPFARAAGAGNLLAKLADDRDAPYTGVGWPH